MKKFSVLFVAFVIAIGFVACKEKTETPVDTTAPVITITIDPSAVVAGNTVPLSIVVTDDVELKDWAYGIILTAEAKKNTKDWGVDITDTKETISGKEVTKTPPVTVDAEAKLGTYTVTVNATDAAGNPATATATFTVSVD